jgi:hypothetical protein
MELSIFGTVRVRGADVDFVDDQDDKLDLFLH